MHEILPGVWHWMTVHEKWGIPVHSSFFPDVGGGVLIDPRIPDAGLDWFGEHGEPAHAILTNRHHYRHSGKFREAFGTTIHCHSAGMHEFTQGEDVEPYEHGDTLAGGVEALEVGVLCPEETALLIPVEGGVLALGDSVILRGSELDFVPDEHMGDDPPGIKRGIKASLGRNLRREFRHLILAHGDPIIGEGKERLRAFVDAP
ncbi:MAG TPA: hypothetical protein VEY33_15865 [Gemmatimonadota bacterium]|nr:hypothetical protein [Gemmatimonadota bacterium]